MLPWRLGGGPRPYPGFELFQALGHRPELAPREAPLRCCLRGADLVTKMLHFARVVALHRLPVRGVPFVDPLGVTFIVEVAGDEPS